MVKEDSIKADAGFEDAVHVLAFVVPCEAVSDEEYLGKLLELKEYARVRGTLPDFLICVAGETTCILYSALQRCT